MKKFKVLRRGFNWPIFIILTATLVVSGFFILINKAQAETLYVCPGDSEEECVYEDGDEYNSIQEAINNATTGDTINVAAGTYVESLIIAKPLTLRGPNAGISPVTGGTRVAEAVITGVSPLVEVETGADVNPLTIEGFTFRDATDGGGHAGVIRADGLVAGASEGWGNVTILSNRFINNHGPAVGVWATSGLAEWTITDNLIDGVTGPSKSGIYLDLDYLDLGAGFSFSGWEVTNNTVRNTQYGGIMVHHSVDMLISGNTIEDVQKTGIQSSGIQGNVTITDNVITRAMLAQVSPIRAGIRLYGTDLADEYGESQLIGPVSVTNNIVTDSYIGFATKSGHDYTAQEVHVNGNSFTGNSEAGLRHNGTGLLDATNNWWGAATGPNTEGADSTEGDVDFAPYYTDAAMTTESTEYSVCASGCNFINIQDAIDVASEEDTINVGAGTYDLDSPIVVDKSLTLTGDITTPSNVIVNAPLTAGLYDRDCFQVIANDVTIQGFRIVGAQDCREGSIPCWAEAGRQNAGIMVGSEATLTTQGVYRGISGGTFSYNEFVDGSKGIFLYHVKNSEISYNTFTTTEGQNPDNFYDTLAWNGDGIHVYLEVASDYPTGNTISHNTMDNVRVGIFLNGDSISGTDPSAWDFQGTTIEGNTMTDVWNAGIILQCASGTAGSGTPIIIKDNDIDTSTGRRTGDEGNERGLISVKGDYTEITGNTLSNSEEHGIWVDGSYHTVTGNTVTFNTKDGIHVGWYKEIEPNNGWTLSNIGRTDTTINLNNIYSNTEDGLDGVQADEEINAQSNWWGDTDPSDDVTANVDYTPWYIDIELTSLKAPTTTDPITGDTVLALEQPIDIINDDIIVSMPEGITITATASWEGVIDAPSIKSEASDTPPRESGYNTTIDTIIEIGYSNIKLVFNKAVRILIPNQAGKQVGYVRPGEDFQEITNFCLDDIQTINDDLPPEGNCKIDVDSDLAVWTKHFTQFIVYSYSPIIITPTFRGSVRSPEPEPEEEPSALSEEAQKLDTNKDDKIDDLDLKELFTNWGSIILDNIADFNNDSKVDVFDFNLLMVHWTE